MSTPPRTTVIVRPHMNTFATLPLAAIVASPTNPRKTFDAGKLAELASSIAASGVHQPVLVRPLPGQRTADTDRAVQYELVAGERRLRASHIAQQATIPAMIRQLSDEQVMEIQIVENLQRTDLTELEEAEGYESLMQHTGLNADQVGAKIGKSRSYVYARLKLLDLCLEAKQALRDGLLDASRALLLARIPDGQLQLKALTMATQRNDYTGEVISVRSLQDWLKKNVMLRLEHAIFKLTDARLLEAAGPCTTCPKRTGANPDLFADVDGADICTDPACYHQKADAHRAALLRIAAAKGYRIVQDQEALDMLDGSKYQRLPDDHISLTEQRPDLCQEGDRPATLGQLLGTDAPAPILFIHPRTQEITELVPQDEARAVLLAKGLIKAEAEQTRIVTNAKTLQHEIDYLKGLVDSKVGRAADAAMFEATRQAITHTSTAQAHALFSAEVLRAWLFVKLDEDDAERFARTIGYQIADGMDEADAVAHHITHLGATDLMRAAALVMLSEDYNFNNAPYKVMNALVQQLGVNTKTITRQATAAVRADYTAQIKALQDQLDASQGAAKPDLPHGSAARPGEGAGDAKAQKPRGRGKPAAAPKITAEEATQGIAAALQGIEGAASEPAGSVAQPAEPGGQPGISAGGALTLPFAEGQRVRITTVPDRLGSIARKWAGKAGSISRTVVDGDPDLYDITFKGRTGGIATFRTDQIEAEETEAAA